MRVYSVARQDPRADDVPVVGAVGVSGGHYSEDAAVAEAALAEAALAAVAAG
jgi:uncharacterized protein GlcG (DUF336 family)